MPKTTNKTVEVTKPNTEINLSPFPSDKSAQRVTWSDLSKLESDEPGSGRAAWEAVQAEALRYLNTGQRAARAFDQRRTPWDEAQFRTLRKSFFDECQPSNAIEGRLIDMLAVTYSAWEWWLGLAMLFAENAGGEVHTSLDQEGHWQPPRVDTVRTQELAVNMTDRYHRQFMRTLRALRDLRRYAPAVKIGSADQVNIGAQQINTSVKE